MRTRLKFYLLFGFFFLGTAGVFTYMHESAHVEILNQYDCNGKIGFDIKSFSAVTIIGENCNWNNDMVYLNMFNDVVGYHLSVIWIAIFYVGLLISIAVFEANRSEVLV